MRAIRAETLGDPEVMHLAEVERPSPGPGEALVRIAVAGVNFVDCYIRSGTYPQNVPYTPGQEGAGIVEALGEGVTDLSVGERVAWMSGPGSYAEYVVVPTAKLVPIPGGIDDRTASAAMMQAITAHYLSHSTYPLGAGDTALVHAGAGGVGLLLTQMARALGATVITTVSTSEKAALSREAGAHFVIDYTSEDFVAAVKQITAGAGVDVVFDSVGKSTFEGSFDVLRPRGYFVLFGAASGPVPPIAPQLLAQKGSLFLTRPTAVDYVRTRDELLSRTNDIFAAIAEGSLRIRVDHTYPLADAVRAHRDITSRATTGKLVLIP